MLCSVQWTDVGSGEMQGAVRLERKRRARGRGKGTEGEQGLMCLVQDERRVPYRYLVHQHDAFLDLFQRAVDLEQQPARRHGTHTCDTHNGGTARKIVISGAFLVERQ